MRAGRKLGTATVVLVVILGSCALAGEEAGPDSTGDRTASITEVPATTTVPASTTTAAASTSTAVTAAVSPRPGGAGIGDRLYPQLGNGGYDVREYRIVAVVDPVAGSIEATTTIEAVALHDLSRFNLDFTGPEVTAARLDGEPVAIRREGGELIVDPDEHLPEGEHFEIAISYSGTPEAGRGGAAPFATGWRIGRDSVFVLSQPDGAQTWFPANDHPLDRADVVLEVTAPDGYTAVSGGESRETGTGTVFRIDDTIPYLVPLAVGEFDRREDGRLSSGEPIVTWFDVDVPPGLLDPFRRQDDIIRFFEERFGPYPYTTAGSLVVEDQARVALETQTVPTYTEASAAWGEIVIAHEISHQWFGNRVAVGQWDDIWLNEGLATFSQWLWIEERFGEQAYEEAVRDAHQLISGAVLLDQGVEPEEADRRARRAYPPPDDPRPDDLFTASVYQRGGLAFVALRDRVGDDLLFELLRTWVERHGGGTVTTEDFFDLVSEMAGPGAAAEVEEWVRRDRIPAMPDRGLEPPR